jgi:hypothetical protein
MWHAHVLERNPNTGLWSASPMIRASALTEPGLADQLLIPPWEELYELGVDDLAPDIADVRGCLLPTHQRVLVRRYLVAFTWPVLEYLTLRVEPDPEPASVPAISLLVPESMLAGGLNVILRVYGSGFVRWSQILFNGGRKQTWFIASNELQTVVNGATAVTPGSYPVQVITDPPGGGLSTSLPFTIEAP